jgi:hypothetical protein
MVMARDGHQSTLSQSQAALRSAELPAALKPRPLAAR